jgi:hypothetical protein
MRRKAGNDFRISHAVPSLKTFLLHDGTGGY